MRLKAKKLKKILTIREKIWNNGITRISTNCNVYFGECFDRRYPLNDDYVANNDDNGSIGEEVNSSAENSRIDEENEEYAQKEKNKESVAEEGVDKKGKD